MGEPFTLLPSPMAGASCRDHCRQFPSKKGMGFACGMALGIQSHLLCRCEEFILTGGNNENKQHRALAGDESFSEPTEICFKGAYEEVPFN